MGGMNSDQLASLVRSVLKLIGAALLTHGATKAAAILNAEDVSGLIVTVVGVGLSYFSHAEPTQPPAGTIAANVANTTNSTPKCS
jgi:hypothetical protein